MARPPSLIIASVFLLLMAILTACALAGADQIDECTGEGAFFEDSFDGEQNCGWALYSRGGGSAAIVDGAMHLTTSQPGQIWWTNPGRGFDDVIVTSQVRQLSGPEDNAFGVLCRYQSAENFYVFLISSDGYYAIGKYQSGSDQIQYLSGDGQYQFSEIINQGAVVNEIRATCIGNQLSLSVNGLLLTTVMDPTFVTGDVGLAASTFQPGTALIAFDDLRVIAP